MMQDNLVVSDDSNHPANMVCSLSRQFYEKEWCVGTGGSIAIRDEETGFCYLAPSGVQKELLKPQDLFVLDGNSKEQDVYLRKPAGLKLSDCTPIFQMLFQNFNAGAIIHTHSPNAVLTSLLYDDVFEISHIEQIKALPSERVNAETGKPVNLLFEDTLKIPIIDNQNFEYELTDGLQEMCQKWPHGCAVLVRRHGIFVWGPSITKAKIYNESIDYLLGLAIKMHQLGIPTVKKD